MHSQETVIENEDDSVTDEGCEPEEAVPSKPMHSQICVREGVRDGEPFVCVGFK